MKTTVPRRAGIANTGNADAQLVAEAVSALAENNSAFSRLFRIDLSGLNRRLNGKTALSEFERTVWRVALKHPREFARWFADAADD